MTTITIEGMLRHLYSKQNRSFTRVGTQEIHKGGNLKNLGHIWRVFGEILPLQNIQMKSKTKPTANQEKPRTTYTVFGKNNFPQEDFWP